MAKFLSWTIYFYDFESYLFDRELFYEKVCFLSGLLLNYFYGLTEKRTSQPRDKGVFLVTMTHSGKRRANFKNYTS